MSFFKRFFQKKRAEKLSVALFGAELINIARKESPDYQYQLGDTNVDQPYFLILSVDNEEYSRVHYGEIYEGYLRASSLESEQMVFSDYVDSLRKLTAGITLELFIRKTNIMPMIKPLSWLEKFAEVEGTTIADCSLITFPLDFDQRGDLCVAFTFDDGDHLIYVNKALVPHFDSAIFLAVTRQNLLDYLMGHVEAQTLNINAESIGYMIHTDGEYEASLVMIMDIIKDFLKLEGSPVIGVLARDILIIADSADQAQVAGLQENAKKVIDELDNSLSSMLYTLTEDLKIQLHDEVS